MLVQRSDWIFFLRDLHQSHGVGANFGPKPFCRKTSPICSVRRTWRQNGKLWRLKDLSERPPWRPHVFFSRSGTSKSSFLPASQPRCFGILTPIGAVFPKKKRLEKMYIRYPSIEYSNHQQSSVHVPQLLENMKGICIPIFFGEDCFEPVAG